MCRVCVVWDVVGVLWGLDYDERVLPSIVNEVTKAVVAKYNASELLTKREVRAIILY